jgi:hypothetical protein
MQEQSVFEPVPTGDASLSQAAPLPAGPTRAPLARRGVDVSWVVAFIVAVFATLLVAVGMAVGRYLGG